jgi:hypothetical protein
VAVKVTGGDDLKIGTTSGEHPILLTLNESMNLRLDVEGLQESSTYTCEADSGRSLSGEHQILHELLDAAVYPWFHFDGEGAAEVSTITTVADTPNDNLDGKYFIIYDAIGSVGVWISTSGGSAIAPVGLDRTIAVIVTTGDSDEDVATFVSDELDDDAAFSSSVVANVVTVTDAALGERVDITDFDSTFTVATTVQGVDEFIESTEPVVGAGRYLQVDLTVDMTAEEVSLALAAVIDADAAFAAPTPTTDALVVTCRSTGVRTPSTAGDTGWAAPTASGTGAASPTVYLESTGITQAVVVVAPH